MQTQIILIFFWCLVHSVYAIQIEAEYLQTFVANGTQGPETQWQQNSFTFACSNTDFQDVSKVVGNVSYAITCFPPLYEFTTILRRFLPAKIRRFTAEYCTAAAVANATGTLPFSPNVQTGPGLFGSLSNAPSRHLRLLLSAAGDAIESGLQCGAEGGVTEITGQGTQGCGGSGGCSCDSSISQQNCAQVCQCIGQNLNDPQKCIAAYNPSLADLQLEEESLAFLELWMSQQQVLDAEQTAIASSVNTSIFQFITAARYQQQQLNRTKNEVQTLAAGFDQNMTFVQQLVKGQYLDLFNLNKGANLLNARQLQFINATQSNFAALISAIQQMAGNASQSFETLLSTQRQTTQLARTVGNALANRDAMTDVRRALTAQLFTLASQAIDQGLIPFWDPSQAGVAPTRTINPDLFDLDLDIVYLNLINGTGNPVAHQYKIDYRCSATQVLNSFASGATWIDVLGQIGPSGCAATTGACNCHVAIGHQQCTATAAFNWQQLQVSASGLPNFLLVDNANICVGGPPSVTSGPWDGVQIDNSDVFAAFLGQICSTKLADISVNCGGNQCQRQLQLVSTRQGALNSIPPPSNPGKTCLPDFTYIFNIAAPENNIITALFTLWISAQDFLLSDNIALETEFFGIPPGHITYGDYPFQVFNDNHTYECYTASFLAVSQDTRPVFEVRPVAVTTQITIEGFETPPVCDEEGCIFGAPAVSSQTSVAGTATVPFKQLLPGKGFPVLGEWRTKGIPAMSTVFNAAQGSVSVSALDQSGLLSYVWQPILDGYNITSQTSYQESLTTLQGGPWPPSTLLDEWLANNIQDFDALGWGGSVDLTEVAFANGECQLGSGEVSQTVCDMFQHWAISPLTDMRQGTLVLQPRTWSYVATGNIVTGEILQRVFAGCPLFQITSYTNGYQQWEVTNNLPTPLSAELTVTVDLTLCPPVGTINVDLLPGQATSQLIFGCPTAIIDLYVLGPGGGTTTCQASYNASYVAGAQGNVQFFTDSTSTSPVLGQAIGAAAIASQEALLALLTSIAPIVSSDISPQLTTLERQTQLDALFAQINVTLSAQAALSNPTPTANSLLLQYLEDFNAGQVAQTNAIAQFAQTVRLVSNETAELNILTALQAGLTNSTVKALQKQIDNYQNDLNSIIGPSQDTSQSGGGPWWCNWCGNSIPSDFPLYLGSWLCPMLCAIITMVLPCLLICCVVYFGVMRIGK